MALLEFYKQVLENLRLHVDDEGYVYVGNEDTKMLLTVDNGKQLVLPTKEHINSLYTVDENGEVSITKCLYNPLNEDVIKGDSVSIRKTKRLVERILSHIIASTGSILIKLIASPEFQKNTPLIINKFLSGLNDLEIGTVKSIVDDKTSSYWLRIYEKTVKDTDGLVSVFLKKRGKHKGEMFNRLAVLHSKTYEELCNYNKDVGMCGFKLRNKDVKLYKYIFEYLIPGLVNDNKTYTIGSNDVESPTFISLMSIFYSVVEKTNSVLKPLENVEPDEYKQAYVKNAVTVKELSELEKYKKELLKIPSDLDINRPTQQVELGKVTIQPNLTEPVVAPKQNAPIQMQPAVTQPVQQPTPYPQTPVPVQQPKQGDPLLRALSNQSIPLGANVNTNPMQQQMVMQPQQPYIQNNMYMQPQMPQQQFNPLAVPSGGLPDPQQAINTRNQMLQQQMAIQQQQQQMAMQQQMYPQQMQMQQPMQQMYPQQIQQPQAYMAPPMQQPMSGRPMGVNSPYANAQVNTAGPSLTNPGSYWR